MNILRDANREYGPRVVALGTFDGVHLGHMALLNRGKALAKQLGCLLRAQTFDCHPLEILNPEKAPRLLTDETEKIELMEKAGVDELRVLSFTKEISEFSPLRFLEMLCSESEVKVIIAGWNYTFGKNGAGTVDTLKEYEERFGYKLEVVPPVRMDDGEIISSTVVREKLRNGDVRRASDMLGYGYILSGDVTSGKGLGRRIGIPTANIKTDPRKMYPRFGVYGCFATWKGETHPAVVNIGRQPTAPSGNITVEAHILDENPGLYDERITLNLVSQIRDEMKFDNIDALLHRIERDKKEALEMLILFGNDKRQKS